MHIRPFQKKHFRHQLAVSQQLHAGVSMQSYVVLATVTVTVTVM